MRSHLLEVLLHRQQRIEVAGRGRGRSPGRRGRRSCRHLRERQGPLRQRDPRASDWRVWRVHERTRCARWGRPARCGGSCGRRGRKRAVLCAWSARYGCSITCSGVNSLFRIKPEPPEAPAPSSRPTASITQQPTFLHAPEPYMYLSMVEMSVLLGTAPMTVSSFWPFLKIITVGMERMP